MTKPTRLIRLEVGFDTPKAKDRRYVVTVSSNTLAKDTLTAARQQLSRAVHCATNVRVTKFIGSRVAA